MLGDKYCVVARQHHEQYKIKKFSNDHLQHDGGILHSWNNKGEWKIKTNGVELMNSRKPTTRSDMRTTTGRETFRSSYRNGMDGEGDKNDTRREVRDLFPAMYVEEGDWPCRGKHQMKKETLNIRWAFFLDLLAMVCLFEFLQKNSVTSSPEPVTEGDNSWLHA